MKPIQPHIAAIGKFLTKELSNYNSVTSFAAAF